MAKRYKKDKTNNKKLIIILAIVLIILGIVIAIKFFYKKPQENVLTNNEEQTDNSVSKENDTIPEEQDEEDSQPVEENKELTKVGGYKVIGKIKISKINLEDVILEKTTYTSLNLGLTKFWGPEMNEIGNFSITGHNYKIDRSPLFSQLDKLSEGDTFSLQDLKNRTVTYKIYKKYTVKPDDTTPIDQNQDGKREATLITCTKGAKERIIFKAREI